jgi:(S)-3,5-dihydroxyphenylglycine transaminase
MRYSSQAAVMNFLNEIAGRYPAAISLAAGRPSDRLFDHLQPEAMLDAFRRYDAHNHGGSSLLQYGRTAGIINELVARQLQRDDGVPADAERLLITAGCQEALYLCLQELCPEPTDTLLVCNPTYIGGTGAAQAAGVGIVSLPSGSGDRLGSDIEHAMLQLQREGRCARALYLIPDFDNPTGRVLDLAQRRSILEICARHRIVVLEDNPYGMFRYEGETVPTMAALDVAGCVIYLSTYSKTLSPALRMGSASLPDTLFGDRLARENLWHKLVERKSFVTVNTSQVNQSIVGGILLDQSCSLREWIRPVLEAYRANRDAMLDELQQVFADSDDDVHWNTPHGGFFLSVDLPFRFVNQHGVIVMPMSFFALDDSQDQRVRLAFSAVGPEQIRTGVSHFSRFVRERLHGHTRHGERQLLNT